MASTSLPCGVFVRKVLEYGGTSHLRKKLIRLNLNAAYSSFLDRKVGRTQEELDSLVSSKPDQPDNSKILKVAIVGSPNTGKSTLTNKLLGWTVSPVSKKVHTTRKQTVCVLTESDTQLVFLDTPGVVNLTQRNKHCLEKSLLLDPFTSLSEADIIAVMADMSNVLARRSIEPNILQALHIHQDKPSILILNKVDLIKRKQKLLEVMSTLTGGYVGGVRTSGYNKDKESRLDLDKLFNKMTKKGYDKTTERERTHVCDKLNNEQDSETSQVEQKSRLQLNEVRPETLGTLRKKLHTVFETCKDKHSWEHFDRVFMVSALDGGGVQDIKDYLLTKAVSGEWKYHSSLVTIQDPQELARMCIWQKLLDYLPNEIPYKIVLDLSLWEITKDGLLRCVINLDCKDKKRYLKYALGIRGTTISRIAQEAKQELMNVFRCNVTLKLVVK